MLDVRLCYLHSWALVSDCNYKQRRSIPVTLRHNWRKFLQQSCQCFQHFPDKSDSASRMSIMYDDGVVGGMCNSRGKLEVNSVTATDEKKKANFKEQCSNQISLQTFIQLVPIMDKQKNS